MGYLLDNENSLVNDIKFNWFLTIIHILDASPLKSTILEDVGLERDTENHNPFQLSDTRIITTTVENNSKEPPNRFCFDARKTTEERHNSVFQMDDYTREMMDLKTLVTRTLEKKGVLAKIRAELRASVFEAIEEEDKVIEKDEGLPPALLGSCNDRAKRLHASPSGRLITALICEYLDWAQLGHTLKVYLPECNLQKDAWKAELRDFSNKNGYDISRNGDSGPLLLDVLEGFLKFENQSQGRSDLDSRNRRPSPSSVVGGLAPLGRQGSGPSQTSERRGGSSNSSYRNDDYNWRYENDDNSEDINRASVALENLQLDRKARNLTTSWRHGEDDSNKDHM